MISYPQEFSVRAVGASGIRTPWKVMADEAETTCCVPKGFEGEGGTFSPEDFFAQALLNCFVATYKVYASYSALDFQEIQASGRLIVDKDETSRQPVMKSFYLDVAIIGASSERKAEALAHKVFEQGFILNSVKTEKFLTVQVLPLPV
jgi:organic hydroperoxide reductase OsmC/OhrA